MSLGERLASYSAKTKSPCLPLTPTQQSLMSDNHKLVHGFLRRKCRRLATGSQEYEELASELNQSLLRAAQTYDGRSKFSTWADQWFRAGYSKWAYARAKAAKLNCCPMSVMQGEGRDQECLGVPSKEKTAADIVEVTEDIKRYLGFVTPRHRTALVLRYLQEQSLSCVAAVLQVSKERARQITEDALTVIRKKANQARALTQTLLCEEVEDTDVNYIGVCPVCERAVIWCGPDKQAAERMGLIARRDDVVTWFHKKGCERIVPKVCKRRKVVQPEFEWTGVNS